MRGRSGARLILGIGLLVLSTSVALWIPLEQTWPLVPITLCGLLVLSLPLGRTVFSPLSLVTPLAFYFFYVAPLLEVLFTPGLSYIRDPPSWTSWFGFLASINAISLIAFRASLTIRRPEVTLAEPQAPSWSLNERRFYRLLFVLLVVSFGLQAWVYARLGGIQGYISTFEAREGGFTGFGAIFIVSESFPILALMGFSVAARKNKRLRSWLVLTLVMGCFFLLKLYFGGLRGSRSNTIWGLFWAAGILHLYVRRIPRVALAGGLALCFAFMLLYGFYKEGGREAIFRVQSEGANAVAQETGRDLSLLLLGDFSRFSIQSYLLYRLTDFPGEYSYAFGRTYLGALALPVPRAVWPNRPPTKVKEGTQLILGSTGYHMGLRSSRVYGLAGEAMLNFSAAVVPLAYFGYGLFATWISRLQSRVRQGDPRLMMLPLLTLFTALALTSDSDNLVFFLLKNGLVPAALLATAARKNIFEGLPASGGDLPSANSLPSKV